MPDLNDLNYSYHFTAERAERKERIDAVTAGNYGKIVKRIIYADCIKYLTSNGLIFIVTKDNSYIITFYLARRNQIRPFYRDEKVPARIYKMVEKNMKVYLRIYDEELPYDHYFD